MVAALQTQVIAFLAALSLVAATAYATPDAWLFALAFAIGAVFLVLRERRARTDDEAARRGERWGAALAWVVVIVRSLMAKLPMPSRLTAAALAVAALVPTAIMLVSDGAGGPTFGRRVRVRVRRR